MTDRPNVPPPPPDPALLERYVLGLLDDAACEALETDACDHPDVACAIDEVETQLVDAYAVGALGAEQRVQFERALAQRPRLHQRVQFARALARRTTPARRARWWLSLAAAAALLVAVALWNARSLPTQVGAPPQGQAQAQAQPTPGANPPATTEPAPAGPAADTSPTAPDDPSTEPLRSVFAVTLPVGVSRSTTTTAVAVPSSSTHVELRVPIAEGDDFPRYRLRVSDARGRDIGAAAARTLSATRTVSIVVERRVLTDGAYEVAVEGLDVQGTPEPLAFLQVRVTGQP